MTVFGYDQVSFRVRPDFAAAHERFWRRLARAGSWWTGEQRVAIAAEARAAWCCPLCDERKAALSPYGLDGAHTGPSDLPETAVEAVHRITTDASRLTGQWYETLVAAGLAPEAYVEIVGTVVALVSIDSFAQALGLPLAELPRPVAGEPSRYRPASARQEEAWVPVVPEVNAGTPEADLWPSGRTGWVIRAMSLVPDEVRTLSDLGWVHYLPNEQVRDPEAAQGALTRPQTELIAGRVSALNQCFY